MNCGAEMDFNPQHPWCPECDDEDADPGWEDDPGEIADSLAYEADDS